MDLSIWHKILHRRFEIHKELQHLKADGIDATKKEIEQ